MGITVHNISATSARVTWPSAPGCLDTFYSVMYHPNWNSLLMGYQRKSFMREDRIPVSQTSTHLANLSPQTTYILCVTCQAANPDREQCQVFSTLSEGSEARDATGWELAMGVWMASSILLLVIAGVLLWGCLHSVCPCPGRCPVMGGAGAGGATTSLANGDGRAGPGRLYSPSSSDGEEVQQAVVIQNPFHSGQGVGQRTIAAGHELRTITKLCDCDPA